MSCFNRPGRSGLILFFHIVSVLDAMYATFTSCAAGPPHTVVQALPGEGLTNTQQMNLDHNLRVLRLESEYALNVRAC